MILRYTLRERVMHWLAGFTYLYLLMSGLAFFAPQLYWMAAILGGGASARYWHPWSGLAFAIVMLWMHRTWRADMRITETDRQRAQYTSLLRNAHTASRSIRAGSSSTSYFSDPWYSTAS